MLVPPGGQPVVERWWMRSCSAMSRALRSQGWHVQPVLRFHVGEVPFDPRSTEALGAGALADLEGGGEVTVGGVQLTERASRGGGALVALGDSAWIRSGAGPRDQLLEREQRAVGVARGQLGVTEDAKTQAPLESECAAVGQFER
jgi:hypothetical protein